MLDGLVEQMEHIPEDAPDVVRNAWSAERKRMKAEFTKKQELPYFSKIDRQKKIVREFYEAMKSDNKSCHVSVGGLDSITLYIWIKSLGYKDVPGISVSAVEDKSIQKVHKALGLTILKSYRSKVDVLNEIGFPVLSKRIAGKIDMLQHPTEDNKTVRHAIITGECGAQGHFAKNSRMRLPQKWLKLFAGYENENEGVNYKIAPFQVSNKCCYYLKEKPCDDWAKEHKSSAYLGLMASEGGQREEALVEHGCNYYGKTVQRSAPFAIFLRQDILTLALEMNDYYLSHVKEFAELYYQQPYSKDREGNVIPYEPLETIVPEIYGEIDKKLDGTLYTTKAQRTGCSMCGFGIQLEQRPHRFDRLRESNPKEWDFWMYKCCTDKKTGQKYGWGRVLNYIGIEWEDIPSVQITLEEYLRNRK